MEDFSLGCSGPTSVAASATVARFVAITIDSTATITKPSRGEGMVLDQLTMYGRDPEKKVL
jgi:hypothetical protein